MDERQVHTILRFFYINEDNVSSENCDVFNYMEFFAIYREIASLLKDQAVLASP